MRYRILHELLSNMQGSQDNMVYEIRSVLQERLLAHKIHVTSIFGREKHLYSIYRKMSEKQLSFMAITDVFGVRIVVGNVDDCYRALGVVHQAYKPIPERFKDYIALPKPNGYQSLHTVLFGPYGVPVEVQIRTQQMDQISANGLAAHWLYKSGNSTELEVQGQKHVWLSRLLEIQKSTANSKEFLENVKVDLYSDAIYVFTPKGRIIELPKHATAMDFAYAIHTDIGNQCIAAKVDRHLVPLSTALVNGNTIEIITAPSAKPNPAWLNVVVTAKAKSGIHKYLKAQKDKQIESIGEQVVSVALRRTGFGDISKEEQEMLAQACQCSSYHVLLQMVGQGDLSLTTLMMHAKKVLGHEFSMTLFKESSDLQHPYALTGHEGQAVIYANCCFPIPKDPIIGVRESDHQLKVHRQVCSHAKQVQAKQIARCMPLSWGEQVTAMFTAGLAIRIINQRGALATLSLAIADMESNILDIKTKSADKHFTQVIHALVEVTSDAHLAKVMRAIGRLSVIVEVERYSV
jgi:RelA/SpoT family (p)ppGpp synthetase